MKTINKIYYYKMTVDSGGAPCVMNDILTLAICKPQIRSTAEQGDWIIGFGGKDLGEKLIYIAEVTEKLLDGAYYKFEQYFDRPDCIYRWNNESNEYCWEKGKKYHIDNEHYDHDLQSKSILLSENFTYFGHLSTDDYKEKYAELAVVINNLKQGHRVNHSEKLHEELTSLISENIVKIVTGNPSDDDHSKSCNTIEGELQPSCKKSC